MLQKDLFSCTYNGTERHVTCNGFENATSRAKTIVILTSRKITVATVHVTGDDVSFYDGPGMLRCKTAKLCINSIVNCTVKTWLLIACGTAFYAIIRG